MLKPDRMPTPRAYLQYVVDHPFRIFALILFITLVFAWRLPALRFQTSIYDLAIEDLPEAAQYQRFKEEFGCEEIILVVARTQNVYCTGRYLHTIPRLCNSGRACRNRHALKSCGQGKAGRRG